MEKLRHRIGRFSFFIGLGLLMPVALTGCNSKSFALDDGIPNTAPTATVVAPASGPAPGPVTLRKTGAYPTFDKQLTAANTQIADDDASTSEGRLAALGRARRSGAISEGEYQRQVAELRKLAAEHGSTAQAQIEN
ncbi:hypothetical protein [Rhizobium sp. LC145]|uniref:hypothetical protein n=1 Tax=Rhizobium sp. LC145 TaxID=1120688 RepID=UPI00062A0F74|nr:hypothetical protein [Rhizobium sp. LC145]KKX25349.1 hypothetical protein YH62_25785 [Rhizobium sp. LC145]TKT46665.1 hypothetical protein FDR95_20845 [Rhizobiaceae bacterium LC148]